METNLESSSDNSTIGLLLKSMLDEQRITNTALHSEVEDVKERVHSTENAITIMTTAVENINSTLKDFSESVKETQKAQNKHWHNQDKLMDKFEAALEKMSSHDAEIKDIKSTISEHDKKGCSYVNNLWRVRGEQLKRYDDMFDRITKGVQKNREEIETNSKTIDENEKQTSVQEEQISDLKDDVKDIQGDIKKGMWMIIGAFVGIVVVAVKVLIK